MKTLDLPPPQCESGGDKRAKDTERGRATTERINTLLDVARYLNSVQDGERVVIECDYQTITQEREGRNLNAHEEDVFNAVLIQLKRTVGFK